MKTLFTSVFLLGLVCLSGACTNERLSPSGDDKPVGSSLSTETLKSVDCVVPPYEDWYDAFGSLVSSDGTRLAIISPLANGTNGIDIGAVHTYRQGEQGWEFEETIFPSSPSHSFWGKPLVSQDNLFVPTNIAGNGPQVEAISHFQQIEGKWTFVREYHLDDPEYSNTKLGEIYYVQDNQLIAFQDNDGNSWNDHRPALYYFDLEGQKSPTKAELGTMSSYMVFSVAISGDSLFLGIPHDDVGALSWAGSVTYYEKSGEEWVNKKILTAQNPSGSMYFGSAISASSKHLLITHQTREPETGEYLGTDFKAKALIDYYSNTDAGWTFVETIEPPWNDVFASAISVSLSGDYFVVSTVFDEDPENETQQYNAFAYALKASGAELIGKASKQKSSASDFGNDITVIGQTMVVATRGRFAESDEEWVGCFELPAISNGSGGAGGNGGTGASASGADDMIGTDEATCGCRVPHSDTPTNVIALLAGVAIGVAAGARRRFRGRSNA